MATLVRWEPFQQLASLQNEMSRFLNGYEDAGHQARTWAPPLDVWETDTEVVYAFDLPGVPEDKVTLEVQDDTLTVTAERAQPVTESSDHFMRFERRYGTFSRAVGLPQSIDQTRITADYANGVLEVHVPKPEQQKPRRIQVAVSGNQLADIEATSSSSD